MSKVIKEQDGYGCWHAYVPESIGRGATLSMCASECIWEELAMRCDTDGQQLSRYVMENIQRSDVQDRPGYIHFVLGAPND